ncbi:hypothetical protein CC77DRAFT_978335 [Alternaria alternata]|uniref:Uncharacterized protein n=1 Tax=Alternaria alternata TaxID=5599 RepID=A0A177E4M6_ALTAL|nr:hypothetical protein CC77DRAFT_978335 [Alternaria alternata]OAG25939.1 hypothetical protein CC77DRAFT_978335 [Alternaria alternata]
MQQKSPSLGFKLDLDLRKLRPYTLFVAIPTTSNSSTFVGYWKPSSSTSRSHIQLHTPLKLAQIQLVDSCEDFGVMCIPAHELGLADFFQRQIESLEISSQDAEMTSKLVASLRGSKAGNASGDGVEVNILSITILGDENGDLVPEGCKLLWRWVKPHSQYCKSGFWNCSLTKVLVDAEWNAGKGVSILVKAAEEEEYDRVLQGEKKAESPFQT